MLMLLSIIKIIGAKRVGSCIDECVNDGEDAFLIAEVLENLAGVTLSSSQLERLAHVISNGSYKSALALSR